MGFVTRLRDAIRAVGRRVGGTPVVGPADFTSPPPDPQVADTIQAARLYYQRSYVPSLSADIDEGYIMNV